MYPELAESKAVKRTFTAIKESVCSDDEHWQDNCATELALALAPDY